jgi:2-dehydropantoate 2-reductase
MPTIAIIGPGAIGGVIAASLHRGGGHEISLCARRPLGPLTVDLLGEVEKFTPTVLTDPAQGRPVDWVLVTTKAYDCAGAAAWFPMLVGPSTRVAVLQNGVEHRKRLRPWLAEAQIVPVMIDLPAERPTPVSISQRGPGKLIVPADADGSRFVALFARTQLSVTTSDDFTSVVWQKLCLNSVGIINALLLKPTGVFGHEDIGALALGIARECMAVARAEGATLPNDLAETILANCRAAPPDSMNSLHADRAAGRPMEIDARNGAILRFGEKHGIPTPLNRMAVTLLAHMSAAGQ